jgi:hypothetical protein
VGGQFFWLDFLPTFLLMKKVGKKKGSCEFCISKTQVFDRCIILSTLTYLVSHSRKLRARKLSPGLDFLQKLRTTWLNALHCPHQWKMYEEKLILCIQQFRE